MIFLVHLFLLLDLALAGDSLRKVLIFSRHGQRAPTTYLKFPSEDARLFENVTLELGELTPSGIEQEFTLGQNLREQYGQLIGQKYKSRDYTFLAGVDNRTITSALSLLAGMFPPVESQVWKQGFNWQPIPVHSNELIDAVSFGVFTYCKAVKEKLEIETDFNDMLDMLGDARYILGNLTGVNITDGWEFDRVLDGVITRLSLPDLLPHFKFEFNLEKMLILKDWMNRIHIHLVDLLSDRSGAWHNDMILANFEDYLRGFTQQKFVLFSGHDTNIMSVARYFNLKSPASESLQDYASYLAVELHELAPGSFYVEFWLHPFLNGTKHFAEIPDCPTPCNYNQFRTLRPRMSSIKWTVACHGISGEVDDRCTMFASLAGGLAILIVALIATAMSALWWCCHYKKKYTELSMDGEETPLLR